MIYFEYHIKTVAGEVFNDPGFKKYSKTITMKRNQISTLKPTIQQLRSVYTYQILARFIQTGRFCLTLCSTQISPFNGPYEKDGLKSVKCEQTFNRYVLHVPRNKGTMP